MFYIVIYLFQFSKPTTYNISIMLFEQLLHIFTTSSDDVSTYVQKNATGNINCGHRTCLSTDNANMLVFIKHNKNFYDRF